jgi:hypothetical protein
MTTTEQATTKRDDALCGMTYKIKAPNYNAEMVNIYLTINEDDAGRPFEVFMNCSDGMIYELLAIAMLLSSRLLQRGCTLEEVADDFEQVSSARIGREMRKHDSRRQARLALDASATIPED